MGAEEKAPELVLVPPLLCPCGFPGLLHGDGMAAQMAGRGGGFGVRGIILLTICGVARRWRQADA